MKKIITLSLLLFIVACKNDKKETDSKSDVSDISTKEFTDYKVEDSKYIVLEELWKPFNEELLSFSQDNYNSIYPLAYDQDIPTIQKHVIEGRLTYENLVKFYLYRIKTYDRYSKKSLNSIIALNPNVVKEARERDNQLQKRRDKTGLEYTVYGIPILLKDNINAADMPTTAGAAVLQNNITEDAFITTLLKEKGALILGKANLSEWAYFFCGDCPSGYSAVGGQTFNPYGKKRFDTGGSSSGSAVAVAANFCAAAIGSETSGSILSPSSQNSAVGLKPTIGLVSRSGIIPISSTLDTAGPITKSVIDNAIVLDAIFGYDKSDAKSIDGKTSKSFYTSITVQGNLKGKRFGVFKDLLSDELYLQAIQKLKGLGVEIIEIEEPQVQLPDFIRLLNLDMKNDLPVYLKEYANKDLKARSIEDIIAFNNDDLDRRAPYGQKLFKGIVDDKASEKEFSKIKEVLHNKGILFFEKPMGEYKLDAILSINNYHAGYAAVAQYPALTVPMGYTGKGEPKGLTLIARPFQEKELLNWALEYEKATQLRVAPENYEL